MKKQSARGARDYEGNNSSRMESQPYEASAPSYIKSEDFLGPPSTDPPLQYPQQVVIARMKKRVQAADPKPASKLNNKKFKRHQSLIHEDDDEAKSPQY